MSTTAKGSSSRRSTNAPSARGTTYLHHDQQGSTVLLTNSTGAATGTYTYTPYGVIFGHTGTATSSLRYTGQYQDDESGLYYLRARYYNPNTGLPPRPSRCLPPRPS